MKVMTKHEVFDDFAFIIEITDEQLSVIIERPQCIEDDLKFMTQACQTKGNNAHILQITLKDEVVILNYIDKLLRYYDSVSWVRNGKLYIRKVKAVF